MIKLFLISGPKRCVVKGYWLYDKLNSEVDSITSCFTRKDDSASSFFQKLRMLWIVVSVFFRASSKDFILVYDNDTTGIYLGLLFSLFRPKLIVHKINAMAGDKNRLYSPLKRVFVRQAYKNIYTSVNNEEIAELYSNFLDLPKEHFIPIPDSISDFGEDIKNISTVDEKGYVFMGGATHRDYKLFVEVAKALPQYKFVAVTFERYKDLFSNAPQNVAVYYGLPEMEFYKTIAGCNIVFVPLINDMQGGQLVVMQGALLHKPIITTDTIAIHTYFDNETAYLIPIGEKNISVKIIKQLMEDKELRKSMGEKAYERISKFTVDSIYSQYKEKLFSIRKS